MSLPDNLTNICNLLSSIQSHISITHRSKVCAFRLRVLVTAGDGPGPGLSVTNGSTLIECPGHSHSHSTQPEYRPSRRQHFSFTWKCWGRRIKNTFIYLEEILIASIIRNGILVSLSWWWCPGESLQWRDTKQMDWGTAIRRTKCDLKSPTKSDHSTE